MRDEEDREAEVALERLDLLEDLALHDDVERGRRLVHDDQLRLERERHRDDHALAHAAGELVRVRADAPAVDADELEQLARARERPPLVDLLVRAHRVDELVADAHHRVERVHRALEDHRDVAPAEAPQLLGALADEVLALGRGCCRRRYGRAGAGSASPRSRSSSCRSRTRRRARAISPSRIARSTPSTARAARSPKPYSTTSSRSSSSVRVRARGSRAAAPRGSSRAILTDREPTAEEHPQASAGAASSPSAGAGC